MRADSEINRQTDILIIIVCILPGGNWEVLMCFVMVGRERDRRRSVKQLMMRLIARAADQQRQIADYEATVSSLTERLDNVNAQLTDLQQRCHDSGMHYRRTPSLCASHEELGMSDRRRFKGHVIMLGLHS